MTLNKQVIIYLIVIFSAIYQDFPLHNLVGEIGRSPIVLLVPFMLVYIISNKTITFSNYAVHYLKYLLYSFLISGVFLVVSYIHYVTLVVLDENIIIKTLKMSVYPMVIFILYQFFYLY